MAALTTYRFLVRTNEENPMTSGPVYKSPITRRLGHDAQAELHAKDISESEHGAWVKIMRPGASLGLRAYGLPNREG